MTDSYFI